MTSTIDEPQNLGKINLSNYATRNYIEKIDLKRAKITTKFWKAIIDLLPEHRRNHIYENSHKKGFIDPLINLKKIIKNCNNKIVAYPFGHNTTSYKISATDVYANEDDTGRLFAANASLQNLPREIRGTISAGAYNDVDMVNAHPVLLSQYCLKNNIRCDNLDKYVKNRNSILSDITDCCEITKDVAKMNILKCMNGGNVELSHPFFNDFKQEIMSIHEKIGSMSENKAVLAKIRRRKTNNILGSLMNNVLCRIENKILLHAVHFLTSWGFVVGALAFDGNMVEKHLEFNQSVLDKMADLIFEKTGYYVEWAIKDMEILDLSKFEKILEEEEKEVRTYKDDKIEWEKTHFKIIFPPSYSTLRNGYNISLQKSKDFLESHRHIYTMVETLKKEEGEMVRDYQKKKMASIWIEDENIKVYDRMDFCPPPMVCEQSVFNMFMGFKIKDVPLPDDYYESCDDIVSVNKFHNNQYVHKFLHLANAIFDNDVNLLNFYLSFCANKLQRPGNRSRVSIIFYSNEKGIGKNRLLDTFNKILGDKYFAELESAKKQLYGEHSTMEERRLLLIVNEAKGIDNLENADILKSRITTETISLNPKGIQPYTINNLCDYVMTTNNDKVVDMDDTERRFLILECGSSLIQNSAYFTDYTKEVVDNPVALRCIYEYLMNWDILKHIPNYDFQNARPITQFQKKSIYQNRPREWCFLEYLVYERHKDDDNEIKFTNTQFWNAYVYFCEKNNFKINTMSSVKFHIIFNKNVITKINKKESYKDCISKVKSNGIRIIKLDKGKVIGYIKEYMEIHDDVPEEDSESDD